jgi:hypothetical protein
VKQQCESEQFIVINDNLKTFVRDFYIKQKEGEKEQDNGETERESVRDAVHCRERKIALAVK